MHGEPRKEATSVHVLYHFHSTYIGFVCKIGNTAMLRDVLYLLGQGSDLVGYFNDCHLLEKAFILMASYRM